MRTKSPLTCIIGKDGKCRYRKKYGGSIYYFGSRGCSHEAALADFYSRWEGIQAGRDPRETEGLTLERMVNAVLNENKEREAEGKISLKHYLDHVAVSKYILKVLPRKLPLSSIGPKHYAKLRNGIAKLSPITQKNRLARISSIFRRAVKLKMMTEIDDADALKSPSARSIRLATPDREIAKPALLRDIIKAANPSLRAALLLGLNCAYINCDCCRLTLAEAKEAIANKYLIGKRVKTGVNRVAALWPETIEALQVVIDSHAGKSEVLFTTLKGKQWRSDWQNTIARDLKKLVEDMKVSFTFSRLRHHFQTIAEERTLDSVAVRHVMGHADHSISNVYRDRVLRKRIHNVCKAVRTWYLSGQTAEGKSR